MIKNVLVLFLLSSLSSIAASQALQGNLENPVADSTESGIGLVSGWHCTARRITVTIDGVDLGESGVGSVRNDTVPNCGGNLNGFSLLYNYNILEPGRHTIRVYADDELFAERQFVSTRSGGVPFLQGTTKTFEVQDFPRAGSKATLQWSQAKQSFVVTATQTNSSQNNSSPSLSDLFGVVTLNYKFTISPTVYSESTRFSSSNISGNIIANAIIGNPSREMGCAIIPNQLQRPYLCLIMGETGGIDAFVFSIDSNGAVSGAYEYCTRGISAEMCGQDLILSPDGTVTGSINRASVGTAAIVTQNVGISAKSSDGVEASKMITKQDQLLHGEEIPLAGQGHDEDDIQAVHAIEQLLVNKFNDRPADRNQ